MIKLILHIYVFWAWTGAWSSHSGFGAVFFCCLWLATLGLGLLCAIVPSGNLIASCMGSWGFNEKTCGNAQDIADVISFGVNIFTIVPKLCVAGICGLLYFVTHFGDNLSESFPSVFPKSGHLFSDVSIPWHAYVALLLLGWSYYSLLKKYGFWDSIKSSMPIVKEKMTEFAKDTGQRSIVIWNKCSPVVVNTSKTFFGATMKQGKAFGLLNVGLIRQGALKVGLLAMSSGNSANDTSTRTSEEKMVLASMKRHIDEHGQKLRCLWRESRYFTVTFLVVTILTVLIVIF